MKKNTIVICVLILFIPIYFIFIWSPSDKNLETQEAFNDNLEPVNIEVNTQELTEEIEEEQNNLLIVNKDEVEKNISKESKDKLNKILLKLSTVDHNRIYGLRNETDINKAINEFTNILEKRLSREEFNEVKSILSPYIRFDVTL